jgi:hypothetical protein
MFASTEAFYGLVIRDVYARFLSRVQEKVGS